MQTNTRLTTVQWIKGNVIPKEVGIDIFDYVALAMNFKSTSNKYVEIDHLENFSYENDEEGNIVFGDAVEAWAILDVKYPSF